MMNRFLMLSFCLALTACGDDGGDADRVGIAGVCAVDDDCRDFELPDGGVVQLECLTQFKGGYCGVPDCLSSAECPLNSICVAHDDGRNYCFRVCDDKPECNVNRPVDDEANCSSSFDWAVEAEDAGEKACIPPSA